MNKSNQAVNTVYLHDVIEEARRAFPGFNSLTCCQYYYNIIKAVYLLNRKPEDYNKLLLLSLFLPESQQEFLTQYTTLN